MSQNPFNPTTWPAYQAWEKATTRIMDQLVRDPGVLNLSGQMLTGMLQGKKTMNRIMGLDPAGERTSAPLSDVVELQQKVSDLERRVAAVERSHKVLGADA